MEVATLTKTKSQLLKERVIAIARDLLGDQEQDIESGIREGIYDKKDNEPLLEDIEYKRGLIDEFEKYEPQVYVFVSGGNIQGASGTETIGFELYDQDNLRNVSTQERDEYIENHGDVESWNKMIEEKTASGEITPIF